MNESETRYREALAAYADALRLEVGDADLEVPRKAYLASLEPLRVLDGGKAAAPIAALVQGMTL